MKRKMEAPSRPLSEFRREFGSTIDQKGNKGFVQIAPGRQVKAYRSHSKDVIWMYRPAVLKVYGGQRPSKELKAEINNQSLDEIRDQIDAAIKQLMLRAHFGNRRAAAMFSLLLIKSIEALDRMADGSKAVKGMAEHSPHWPVVLSLNSQDVAWAEQRLKSLKVGTKATVPTYKGQRVDFRNLWTVLAKRSLDVCIRNIQLVHTMLAYTENAVRKPETEKYFGKIVEASFFYVSQNEVIVFADWQEECGKLRLPITEANLSKWWSAVRGCVLEYWKVYPREYKVALKQIGQVIGDDTLKRNRAMRQVEQAFKSLLGLRSKRARGTVSNLVKGGSR